MLRRLLSERVARVPCQLPALPAVLVGPLLTTDDDVAYRHGSGNVLIALRVLTQPWQGLANAAVYASLSGALPCARLRACCTDRRGDTIA